VGNEADVVARYRAGDSTNAIAREYGVTPSIVGRMLRKEGVEMRPRGPYRRPLADKEEQVAALYRAGFSLKEIAELASCSTIAVKGALARGGVALRPRGSHATRAVIEQRRELLDELAARSGEPGYLALPATLRVSGPGVDGA